MVKKIAALTAAIAMVLSFAVCAGAVNVDTTTQYVEGTGNAKVNVIANVSGLEDALYVTYYATNDDGVVYVDQEDVFDGEATFDYVTSAANLNSNVKVGYAAGTDAEEATVDGYTVTVTGGTATPAVIPTEFEGTVVLAYAVASGFEVTGVEATGAEATLVTNDATSVTVNLADVVDDVVITVTTQALENVNATATYIDAAAIVSTGVDTDAIYDNDTGEEILHDAKDPYKAGEGDRKLTVLAQVANSNAYGVIITADEIETGAVDALPTAGVYAAKGFGNEGYFAVQLIDTGADEEGALIQSGVDYNVYVYYATSHGYMIIAGEAVNTTVAE